MKRNKADRYLRVYEQLISLTGKTESEISRMATINAVLHYKIDGFFWTGFYLINGDDLKVGPYQGPLACQVLEKNKGVCWTCINTGDRVIIKNVNMFPGHIACDPRSKSEIALPLRNKIGKIVGVLDVDSKSENNFDEIDADYLQKITDLVYR